LELYQAAKLINFGVFNNRTSAIRMLFVNTPAPRAQAVLAGLIKTRYLLKSFCSFKIS